MIYVINTRTENTVRKGESTVYQPFDNIEGKEMLVFSHNAFYFIKNRNPHFIINCL